MSQRRHKQPSPGTRVKNGILCTYRYLQNKPCQVQVHRVWTSLSWLLSSARAWKHDGREWFVTSVRWTLIWKKRLLVILINIASHKIGVRSGWYCMKGEKRCAKLKCELQASLPYTHDCIVNEVQPASLKKNDQRMNTEFLSVCSRIIVAFDLKEVFLLYWDSKKMHEWNPLSLPSLVVSRN